jgi:hypothetical protein
MLSKFPSMAVRRCGILSGTGTLSYTSIQSIPNLLIGWLVWWVCRPWKNWDMFSFQELCTDPLTCRRALSCWSIRRWWWMNGPQGFCHGISVHSNCHP